MDRQQLDKDPAILSLIDRLSARLGPNAFVIADHWEPDLCAIGIASPQDVRILAYVSCFGELPDRFNYELESPPLTGEEFPYRVAGRDFNVSFEELADIVKDHICP